MARPPRREVAWPGYATGEVCEHPTARASLNSKPAQLFFKMTKMPPPVAPLCFQSEARLLTFAQDHRISTSRDCLSADQKRSPGNQHAEASDLRGVGDRLPDANPRGNLPDPRRYCVPGAPNDSTSGRSSDAAGCRD